MASNKSNKKKNSLAGSSGKSKIKKEYLWVGIGAAVILIAVLAFFIFANKDSKPAGSADSAATPVNGAQQAIASDSATDSSGIYVVAPDTAPEVSGQTVQQAQPEQDAQYKYSDAELYEKDGNLYGKTEDGTEVEVSGENLQSLMEEYALVQGTGSEKERQLLDQIQMILDNADEIPKE